MEVKLNDACKEQAQMMRDKGFEPASIPTQLMLIVSELSEALEADRKGMKADMKSFEKFIEDCSEDSCSTVKDMMFNAAFKQYIKDSFEDEIADAFLRLMNLCGIMGIDIEKHIKMKAKYNSLRPHKFGKAY